MRSLERFWFEPDSVVSETKSDFGVMDMKTECGIRHYFPESETRLANGLVTIGQHLGMPIENAKNTKNNVSAQQRVFT